MQSTGRSLRQAPPHSSAVRGPKSDVARRSLAVVKIRPARPDDKPHIAVFTQDTFEWGDYVYDSFDTWVADDTALFVAVADDDLPIGLARAILMSDREIWLHAARVHPDHRRKGIGATLNDALCEWGRDQGALIARLAIEDWNQAAQGQVAKNGYRKASRWIYAKRDVDASSPNPMGNGGTRVPGPERLIPAPSAEVEPAWVAWSSGTLSRAARGLFSNTWWWRVFTEEDLLAAAKGRRLWSSPTGWVIARETKGSFVVDWLEATDDEVTRLVRAIVDKAVDLGVDEIQLSVPSTEPVRLALNRYGFSTMALTLFEVSL